MARWQLSTAVFLVYLLAVALTRRGIHPRVRAKTGGAIAGAFLVLLASLTADVRSLANVLFFPPMLLLIGYWISGWLFVAPMPAAERWLAAGDEKLRVQQIAARTPRALAEIFEFAYAGVYPLILVALFLAVRSGVSEERFWTAILVTDYICFGILPWFQTRPPRAVGFPIPWQSSWRSINLRLLDAGSIQVNTFPSGHAAEALAAALLVSGAPWPVAAFMFASAAAISAGAVFGRYHYAADAVAGWLVALLVYVLV